MKKRDWLDSNIKESSEHPKGLSGTATVTHHAQATLDTYHELTPQVQHWLPKINRCVITAQLISRGVGKGDIWRCQE